jgi:hypothetical protein
MNFIVIILMVLTLTIFLSVENNIIFPSYPQTIENDNKGELSINQISPCSMTIEADFKLETNLNCYKDGLIVSGSGITIDLNDQSLIERNNIKGSGIGLFLDQPSNNNQINDNILIYNTVDINDANDLAINLNNNQYYQNKCMVSEPAKLCLQS